MDVLRRMFVFSAMATLLLLSVSVEVSRAQTNFTKSTGNPVISAGPSGSWDGVNAVHPFVVFDGFMYRMWYSGQSDPSSPGRIGLATSFDGVTWAKYSGNPVLSEGSPGSWDSGGVGPASVIFDGATYKMWYTGAGSNPLGSIGFATSTDGVNWVRYSGNPVVSSSLWASAFKDPYVLLKDGIYWMYFAGFDGVTHDCGVLDGFTHFCVGLAKSTNGITWDVLSKPVLTEGPGSWDSAHMSRPVVVVEGPTWHMWYTGSPFGPSQIGYASSSDGISWTKFAGNPVLTWGSPGAWDSIAVGAGTVIIDISGFRMWYSGADTLIQSPDQVAHFQIGLATELVTKHTTSTSVSCSLSVLLPNHSTTCTAILIDTSPGTPITPTGIVSWSNSGKGIFNPNPCTLKGTGATATCIVTYTASPGRAGVQTITATYSGDSNHSVSSGSTRIAVP